MRFRSKFEEQVAKSFDKQGHTYLYEPSKITYQLSAHIRDFCLPNGIYLETKGFSAVR